MAVLATQILTPLSLETLSASGEIVADRGEMAMPATPCAVYVFTSSVSFIWSFVTLESWISYPRSFAAASYPADISLKN